MSFTLIVLIGTWSFLSYYLQEKDKKVLMIVILLQVVSNIDLSTKTSYRYTWMSHLARECATIRFYVFMVYKFRLIMHNPYLVIEDEEEEVVAQASQLDEDDNFEI